MTKIYCNRKGLVFITNCFAFTHGFETTYLYNGGKLIGKIEHRDCGPGFTAVIAYDYTIISALAELN